MEDPTRLDRRALALAKVEARRLRITRLRKTVGIFAGLLAVGFSSVAIAFGAGASGFTKSSQGGNLASSGSGTQGGSPTVVALSSTPSPQTVSTPQYYQPPSSPPVQTAQS